MWSVTTLQIGYPGRSTHHGTLGWSTIGLARGPGGRIALLDTGGFAARRVIARGLAAQGLSPADVTDLLLTHLHHDHMINWPMFGSATIHAPRAEMAWALAQPDGHESLCETALRALSTCPRLRLFDPGEEVLPGVATAEYPGHTPHHVAFTLAGDPPTLFSADIAKNRIELLTGEADMTLDAERHRDSIARLRAAWAALPGAVLMPGHDAPMLLDPEGKPRPLRPLEAGIEAWFGASLAEMTRFSLVP
ncbi:MAG: MBL fold metallo-hydrolase [Rhodovarius sp.]|nr:MBL fold metallo-hydrolase [Rhodovarius sp.]